MDLPNRLEGLHLWKTLALLSSAFLPERFSSFADVLDQYAAFKTMGYQATDHRLKVRSLSARVTWMVHWSPQAFQAARV